ncbi:MerR family transcriptional regulator [Salininema proteolyticum]|uniref:MerR family transcriptional regulator n=1 Tax=Salininema proteolyticum TaxID=1607685 RepID=A0ABV8TXS9_9ACTN
MKIGELSRRTGISERSLRYYEKQGILRSERTPGGHRVYGEWAVDRVIRIQILLAAGLSSDKINYLLPCLRDADGGPNERTDEKLRRELEAERDRIDESIRDLMLTRDILDEVIETAEPRRSVSA